MSATLAAARSPRILAWLALAALFFITRISGLTRISEVGVPAAPRRHELLFAPRTPLQRAVSVFLAVLIVANVVATMLATLPDLDRDHLLALGWFEFGSIAVFLVEYLLRAWCCVEDPRHDRPWGRARYLITPLALIDAGRPDAVLCSIAKVFATEMAQRVTLQCQQMFGGYGYFGSLPLERMVRDVRMLTLTGGTTQTQKNVIAAHIFDGRRTRSEA